MGSTDVFGCLKEIFPQVDFRLLRAFAFEHPTDADAAVLAVINEFPELTPQLENPLSPPVVQCPEGLPVADDYKGKGKLLILQQVNDESGFIRLPELGMAAGESSTVNGHSSDSTRDVPTLVEEAPHSFDNGPVTSDSFIVHTESEERVSDVLQPLSGMTTPSGSFIVHTENDGVNDVHPEWKDLDFPAHDDPDLVILKTCHNVESGAVDSSFKAESSLAQLDSPFPQHFSDAPQWPGPLLADDNLHPTDTSDLTSSVCNADILEEIIEDAKNNKKTLFAAMESVISMMREVEVQENAVDTVKQEASKGGLDIMLKVEELKDMLSHAKAANDMHAGEVYGEKAILATEVRELQSRLLSLSDERDKSLAMLNEMRETLEERLEAAAEARKMVEQEKLENEESARRALAEQEAEMEKVVQESKKLQQQAEENSKLREFLMDRGRIVDMLQGEISVICQDVRLLKEKFDERVPLSQSVSSSQTSCILASSGSSVKSMAFDLVPERVPSVDGLSPKSRVADEEDGLSSKGSRHEDDGLSPKASRLEDERTMTDQKALIDEGWDVVFDF